MRDRFQRGEGPRTTHFPIHQMRRALIVGCLALPSLAVGQRRPKVFSHADTVRGSNGPGRSWWDASFYDLHVSVNPADSSIRGRNGIVYRVLAPGDTMQIDLRAPLIVDSIVQRGRVLSYRRDGDAYFAAITETKGVG